MSPDSSPPSETDGWQLPEGLRRDFRQWLHDVRGAAGIVSSTLELLSQEDMHPVAVKYIQIVQRQVQRLLMESELFGAYLHFRPEAFEGEECAVFETFTEVQDLVGTGLEVQPPGEACRVRLSPYLMKLVFLAILIPPSSLDPREGMRCVRAGDRWHLDFGWTGAQAPLAPKFQWADHLLRQFGAGLELLPGRLRVICPVA